ncbi:MAG: hypothetical protein Q7N50_07400 [Armatimonadota bacterium]|nr:hypothetical protein [Armatimonadota bacterium]
MTSVSVSAFDTPKHREKDSRKNESAERNGYMSKNVSLIALAVAVCALAIVLFAVGNRYKPIEVQSGSVVECLDPKHVGNSVIRSSIKAIRVPSKDAGNYGIAVKSLVCAKCQARARVEDEEARARKRKEDVFIAALRKHDDAVLLCCRQMAGTAAADPYAVQSSIRRYTKRLRSLALSGKQLCAPQSLAEVEYKYGKSMDELLASLPYIERGVRNVDMDDMQSGKLHVLLSKQYRDEAISGIEGR